eukprot:SAG31_NODE_948_length_10825_cov_9.412829_3_plen_92_part_00
MPSLLPGFAADGAVGPHGLAVRRCEAKLFLVSVQLFEKCGTLIERNGRRGDDHVLHGADHGEVGRAVRRHVEVVSEVIFSFLCNCSRNAGL